MTIPYVLLAAALFPCGAAYAQTVEPAGGAKVPKTARAHVVQGAMSEADWQQAELLQSFIQREPSEGLPATYQTEARVVTDATALHVIVHAADPDPGKIVGYLTRRDEDSPSDWIHLFIDSYHDRRTGYQFAVNAAGVKRDVYWFNDGNDDAAGTPSGMSRCGVPRPAGAPSFIFRTRSCGSVTAPR